MPVRRRTVVKKTTSKPKTRAAAKPKTFVRRPVPAAAPKPAPGRTGAPVPKRIVKAKAGDSLSKIAEKEGFLFSDVQDANKGISSVFPGMNINLPLSTVERTVQGLGPEVPQFQGSLASLTGAQRGTPSLVENLGGGSIGILGSGTPQFEGAVASLTGAQRETTISGLSNLYTASFVSGDLGAAEWDPRGGALDQILNQLEATGTHYDAAGRRVIGFGDEEIAADTFAMNSLIGLLYQIEDFPAMKSLLPATIPPQIASIIPFDTDISNLYNEMAALGYSFDEKIGMFVLDDDASVGDGGGGGGFGGGGGKGGGSVVSGLRAGGRDFGSASGNMLSWRVATG